MLYSRLSLNRGGFLIKPTTMEFWCGGAGRMHDRIRFRYPDDNETIYDDLTKEGDNGWVYERLSPWDRLSVCIRKGSSIHFVWRNFFVQNSHYLVCIIKALKTVVFILLHNLFNIYILSDETISVSVATFFNFFFLVKNQSNKIIIVVIILVALKLCFFVTKIFVCDEISLFCQKK